MGFFGRGEQDDEKAEQLERIQRGGIPQRAQERLRGLGTEGSLFTSGLSVNEFALLDQMGPRPLAQVMGASVVRTGWQLLPALDPGLSGLGVTYTGRSAAYGPVVTGAALQNPYGEASPSQIRTYRWRTAVVCALDVRTDAWNMARRRALDRLREEASCVGADAVVGVRLRSSDHDLGEGTIEYVVTGTAIRLPNSAGEAPPILTDVSVQDYWRLHAAGQEPVGFVAGTAVVFASASRSTRLRRRRNARQNQELDELSRGFHEAREAVRSTLLSQVSESGGVGAVGVEFAHSIHREAIPLASALQSTTHRGWHRGRFGVPYRVSGQLDVGRSGWVITMHAAGTAIRPARTPPPDTPPVKSAIRVRVR